MRSASRQGGVCPGYECILLSRIDTENSLIHSIKVREVAVEKISKDPTLTPFEKLAIAQKYNVSTWVIEACEAIAKDFHQIKSIEELASQIDWESAARIAWVAAQRPDQEADRSGLHDVQPDPPPTSLIVTENEPGQLSSPTRSMGLGHIFKPP